jgi:hypothetical protein
MNKIPDITPHLVYPDDPEYVEAATKYWNALHQDWIKSAEKIQEKVFNDFFFKKDKQ